jgi:hypothetical protein
VNLQCSAHVSIPFPFFYSCSASFSDVLQHLFDLSFGDLNANVRSTFHQSLPLQVTASDLQTASADSNALKPVFVANVRVFVRSLQKPHL